MNRTLAPLLASTILTATPLGGAALAQDAPTGAPPPAEPSQIAVTPVASGLETAFSFVPLPDGDFLVAERTGTLRLVRPDGFVSLPVAGVPEVKFGSASGLHDIVLDP